MTTASIIEQAAFVQLKYHCLQCPTPQIVLKQNMLPHAQAKHMYVFQKKQKTRDLYEPCGDPCSICKISKSRIAIYPQLSKKGIHLFAQKKRGNL